MKRKRSNGPIRFDRWLPALALVALPGCNPVFAPPVRSTHGVAPRDLSAGGVELMGAANVYGSGGPTVGVGVGSGLRVEAAGDFRQIHDNENWAMGSAGVRYSVEARENRDDHGLSFDVGSGLGLGVGGTDERDVADGERPAPWAPWDERLAYGAYLDVGAGYLAGGFPWLAPFIRVRGQVTGADDIPRTVWGSGLVGVEVVLGPVSIPLGTGIAGYSNRLDSEVGWLAFEGGLALRWDESE